MTWVKLDDHFDEHPKFAAVGPLGIAMFVCALAYCNRNLTDGFVPRAIVRTLVDWTVPDADGTPWRVGITAEDHGDALGGPGYDVDGEMVAKVLLEHGLFEKAPGGYRIHDYGDFQPSKERVLAERKAASDRMQKVRGSRGSPELRANIERSSPEVRDEFAGSSPNPVPVPEPEVQEKKSPNGDSATKVAHRLFEHYKIVWGHPRAVLTPPRRALVARRLRDGYDEATLAKAIDGSRRDDWPGRSKPLNHDFELLLRDAKHIEAFVLMAGGANGMRSESEDERESRLRREMASRGPR